MSSTTLASIASDTTAVPPSPTNLKAVFTPRHSEDSDSDMESDDEQPLEQRERSFKDSVHGWSESRTFR